jgi:hypothetical protein
MVAAASFMVGTASRVYSFAGPSVVGAKYRFGSVVVGGGAASTAVFGVSPSPGEVIAVFCGVFEAEDELGGDITGPLCASEDTTGPNPPSFAEMSQQKL